MKVITIKEPWASLIASGYKKYEFRTWKTNYRGELYIHAGLGNDKSVMFDHLIKKHNGYIIAKCNLVDVKKVDIEFKKELMNNNEHGIYDSIINDTRETLYAFCLDNVTKIDKFKATGKLSLWNM